MSDHQKPDPSELEKQRVVRVFISSTFRDMHAERDELVKFIFPELRRKCRERQVEFVEVDLRWGITEEESKQGKVLPICLEEIKRCKPYFIGLLGERYGWVPQNIPQEIVEREQWLKEHIGKTGKSVTELEILHGVLNNPEMAAHAFFYFRDPAYIKTIPADKQKDFATEGTEDTEKLKKLKNRIRKSGQTVRENYSDPKALGKLVLEDLWTVIDEKFPIESVPTALERERMDHEAFAAARQKVYIGREIYFKRLDEHVASANPPLVILGESGSGKSALIANWVKRYKEAHPNDFMITHFIGGTADSADYVKILRRIMEEIRDRYEPANPPSSPFEKGGIEGDLDKGGQRRISERGGGSSDEIPTDPEKVKEQFPTWLAKAAAKGTCILVLDALNQLEDRDNAPDLGWLPGYFPPNVRVILSTLTAEKEKASTAEVAEVAKREAWRRPWEALKRRGWQVLNVELLNEGERRVLVEKYLARFARKLSEKNMDKIIAVQQTANPLYLKVLLDELRVFGLYEELGKKIDYYLTAETVDDLYEKVLERLEKDYEQERKSLVSEAMSLIWASRRGLSEPELLALLGKDNEPMPRAYWSPLYLALEESLVSRSGLLTFFHDYLKKAVEDRYFKDDVSQKTCHLRLADYFEKRETDDRKASEFPWQLQRTEEWKRLANVLTRLDFFSYAWDKGYDRDVVSYWYSLFEKFDPATCYEAAVLQLEQDNIPPRDIVIHFRRIGFLLERMAFFVASRVFYMRALKVDESCYGVESLETANDFKYIGLSYYCEGNFESALTHLTRALDIQKQINGLETIPVADLLSNISLLHWEHGHFIEAKKLCEECLSLREKLLGTNHRDVALSLNNLAAIYHVQGFYAEALPYYERALAIREKTLMPDDTDIAQTLNNIGSIYFYLGQYQDSLYYCQKALKTYEQAHGPTHPYVSQVCNNIAIAHHEMGNLTDAERWMRRVIEIDEARSGLEHPNVPLHFLNLGIIYSDMGKLQEALKLKQRALEIGEKVFGVNHPYVANYAKEVAATYLKLDDVSSAEPLLERARVILERNFGKLHPDLCSTLEWMGVLFEKKHDLAGAEQAYSRALEISEQLLGKDHPYTATSLNNLAGLLESKGDYVGAEPLYRRALDIREKVLGKEHPNTIAARYNLAQLLRAKGDHKGAAPLYRQLIEIYEGLLKKNVPILPHISEKIAISNNNLAFDTLVPEKNWEDAEHHYKKAIEIFNKVPDPIQAANSELNLQTMYHLSGQQVDVERVKALTRILEEAGDKRAEKGHMILKEISE